MTLNLYALQSNQMMDDGKQAAQRKIAQMWRESEERQVKRLSEKSGLPYADLGTAPISLEALKLIPEEKARANKMAAIELRANNMAVAAADPDAAGVKEVVAELEANHYKVKIFVVSSVSLEEAWRFYKFVSGASKEITGRVEIEEARLSDLIKRMPNFKTVQDETSPKKLKELSTTAFLETILAGALANRVSDIHFEAGEKSSKIRFRVDGILHDVTAAVPPKNYDSLLSRIKLLSGLKINVHGEPQDGRFTIHLLKKEIEMRVSIIPSEYGETVVTRILDPDAINVQLEELGLRPDDLVVVKKQLAKPNGLILNTGPTGSGKTTTLYAFLKSIVSSEIKIITVEDPIEYRVEGVQQTQVDEEAGYTFAGGLRAIVRQDPDVILIGEIRDLETADIALQASLTGHLVLSTLHTNSAVGAVPRLVDLGVKVQSIGPALNLIIAQRLVRKLCDNCKKEVPVPEELKKKLSAFLEKLPARIDRAPYQNYKTYEPAGCDACGGFGYKGRRGIFEFFNTSLPEFEITILKDSSEVAVKKLAASQEMATMQQDGVLKVLAGITTLKEVENVTGEIVW